MPASIMKEKAIKKGLKPMVLGLFSLICWIVLQSKAKFTPIK